MRTELMLRLLDTLRRQVLAGVGDAAWCCRCGEGGDDRVVGASIYCIKMRRFCWAEH